MLAIHVRYLVTELLRYDLSLDNLLRVAGNFSISLEDILFQTQDIVNRDLVFGVKAGNTTISFLQSCGGMAIGFAFSTELFLELRRKLSAIELIRMQALN
jgi:hypothetical protein